MKSALPGLLAALLCPGALLAAQFSITVSHDLPAARPGEVITVPFAEVQKRLPNAEMFKLVVKDAKGAVVPSQITNYEHDHKGIGYDELVFQHDFPAGEKSATFTVETVDAVVPPLPPRVFARFAPDRYDDFAWENDRIGHRVYGPALDSAAAGREKLRSSGVDIWAKKVRYPIIDRWYLKGHDAFHKDDGEGLDLYSIGPSRGAGGSGVWDGEKLITSGNFKTWKILANGPLRAIFELTYEPWDAGNGVKVSEVKRFTVEAGRNFDTVESTFSFEGAPELTVGFGITKHPNISGTVTRQEKDGVLGYWEDTRHGGLGIAIVLDPAAPRAGYAEEALGKAGANGNLILLTKVKSGQPIRYYLGAGWDRSLDFKSRADWDAYVAAWPARIASPIQVTLSDAK